MYFGIATWKTVCMFKTLNIFADILLAILQNCTILTTVIVLACVLDALLLLLTISIKEASLFAFIQNPVAFFSWWTSGIYITA
jgi:hypothetical protein